MVFPLLLALVVGQGLDKPAALPTEEYDAEIGVRATVNGKEVGLALKPFWPKSYLVGGDGKPAKVVVGEKTLAQVPLSDIDKAQLPGEADGVLGQDALRQATFVFDPMGKTLRVVTQTKISAERAQSLMDDLPSWDGLTKAVRIPLKRTPDGVPTVSLSIDGETSSLMLRLSFTGTCLDASVTRPPEAVSENDWSFLPNVEIGGFPSSWMAYAPRENWALAAEKEGAGGTIGLDAFHSRRVIVDLAGDAIYVERLPEEARLSMILREETALPVILAEGKLVVGLIPGEDDNAPLPYPKGAQVASIAGVKAEEWVADLRAGSAEAAARMAKRMLLLDQDYAFVVRKADGTQASFTVPHDARPSPPASLRAAARALAASSSR